MNSIDIARLRIVATEVRRELDRTLDTLASIPHSEHTIELVKRCIEENSRLMESLT